MPALKSCDNRHAEPDPGGAAARDTARDTTHGTLHTRRARARARVSIMRELWLSQFMQR